MDTPVVVISTCVLISLMLSEVSGGCTPLPYPKELKECYEELNKYENEIPGGKAAFTCITDYLWVTAGKRWHPDYRNETLDYLGNLYRKYMNEPPVREKRQTSQTSFRRFREQRRQFWRRFSRKGRGSWQRRLLSRRRPRPPPTTPPPTTPPPPTPPPPPQPCVRKELRQLTEEEYRNFINCLNEMKSDRSVFPNAYEAIASIHNSIADPAAHRGQAFLGWHTLYMLVFEFRLRECTGSPCLPYWDTTLDQPLPDPRESIFFKLIGGTSGPLQRPLERWTYRSRNNPREFVRRAVSDGHNRNLLISNRRLNELLTSTDTSQMSRLSSFGSRVIEWDHNSIHNYLSGTAAGLVSAPHDIIFFLLHCFIEYIFTENLNKMPEHVRTRYPRGRYPPGHAPDDTMGVLGDTKINSRTEPIKNIEAYRFGPGSWRSHFRYASRPRCPDCYTPRDNLFCCESINQCVTKVRIPGHVDDEVGIIPSNLWGYCTRRRRFKRNDDDDTEDDDDFPYVEQERYIVQNDYLINGISDKNDWVHIAVLITNNRPKDEHFRSYFVQRGVYEKAHDIYDASGCSSYNNSLKVGKALPYKGCAASRSGSSGVYVRTDGINYNGHYKDYAIIDDRFAVSESVAYVAVKKPRDNEVTEVLVTAYDECGRLCRPMCEVRGSYESCDGVLRIDNRPPLVYGHTLNDAMAMHWGFSNRGEYRPYLNTVPYCINFVCDATTDFYRKPRK